MEQKVAKGAAIFKKVTIFCQRKKQMVAKFATKSGKIKNKLAKSEIIFGKVRQPNFTIFNNFSKTKVFDIK